MEEHRLTEMKPGYDEKLFNELYEKTTPLKRRLAGSISAGKLGVDYDEILSWFDVKFIYVFNKYFETKSPEVLKGFLLNSLSMFRNRILKVAYSEKNSVYRDTLELDEVNNLESLTYSEREPHTEFYLNKAMSFITEKISDDSLLVLQIDLDPPLYIKERMERMGKKVTNKIPSYLVADYLSLGKDKEAVNYINELRREYREATQLAKEHFALHPVSLN